MALLLRPLAISSTTWRSLGVSAPGGAVGAWSDPSAVRATVSPPKLCGPGPVSSASATASSLLQASPCAQSLAMVFSPRWRADDRYR